MPFRLTGLCNDDHRLAAETGTMWPIHTTSTGKAVLAALPRQRRRELVRAPLKRFTSSTITGVHALLREVETVSQRGYATAMCFPTFQLLGIRNRSNDVMAALAADVLL